MHGDNEPKKSEYIFRIDKLLLVMQSSELTRILTREDVLAITEQVTQTQGQGVEGTGG